MDEPAPEVVLQAEGVTAGYGGPPIIEDVSLTVYARKITAIVGPNGAGKSTLLKALSGVLKASRGEVYVLGQKTTNIPPEKLVKRGLGYVPQVGNVFPDLTVRENLEMGAYTRRRGVSERIGEVCEQRSGSRSRKSPQLASGSALSSRTPGARFAMRTGATSSCSGATGWTVPHRNCCTTRASWSFTSAA